RNWSRSAMTAVAMRVVGDEPFPKDASAPREDADVVLGLVPDHALHLPSCVLRDSQQLVGRDEEEVEPIADSALVPHPEGEETGGSAAAHVPLDVREMVLGPRARNPTVSDQPASLPHDPPKVPEEPAEVGKVPREP